MVARRLGLGKCQFGTFLGGVVVVVGVVCVLCGASGWGVVGVSVGGAWWGVWAASRGPRIIYLT